MRKYRAKGLGDGLGNRVCLGQHKVKVKQKTFNLLLLNTICKGSGVFRRKRRKAKQRRRLQGEGFWAGISVSGVWADFANSGSMTFLVDPAPSTCLTTEQRGVVPDRFVRFRATGWFLEASFQVVSSDPRELQPSNGIHLHHNLYKR